MDLNVMNAASILKKARLWRKEGNGEKALELIRTSLRAGQIDENSIDQTGRFILTTLDSSTIRPDLRILLLGQCTLTWLKNGLAAKTLANGLLVDIDEGDYDNIIQNLLTYEPYDITVLFPWSHRVLSSNLPIDERLEGELAVWNQGWRILQEKGGSRIIQVSYDWIRHGVLGHHLSGQHGDVSIVHRLNNKLRADLPEGSFFLSLDQVSGSVGRSTCYDARNYHWSKNPFSELGNLRVSHHLAAAVRTVTTGPKKILVVDLDNTMWGGVVGECGPLNVAFGENPEGEAFRAFQSYLKQLIDRGILVAVSSKNNVDDAQSPFVERSDRILTMDDFAAFEANWQPKHLSLEKIANELNLGLDSFVFFDDSAVERENIRQFLPEVDVVEVPDDPADYVDALERGLYFESLTITEEDNVRADHYRQERNRRHQLASVNSIEDYLDSLEMRGSVEPVEDADMQRVVQLIGKTNQFNLTTKRHTTDYVVRLRQNPLNLALSLKFADKFGDYGTVGVLFGTEGENHSIQQTIHIDTFLMSCRVIGRTAEDFFFAQFLKRALELGYKKVSGIFIPTQKNRVVKDLYPKFGFGATETRTDGSVLYDLDVTSSNIPPHAHVTHIAT